MKRVWNLDENKKRLRELEAELLIAEANYIVSRDKSLEYDKTSTWNNPDCTEPARDYLVRDGRIVIDLKHDIKMTKYRIKRAVRKALKEVA